MIIYFFKAIHMGRRDGPVGKRCLPPSLIIQVWVLKPTWCGSCPLTSSASGLWFMCLSTINKQKWDEKRYIQQQNLQETEISWLRQEWIRQPGRDRWGRRNTHKSLVCDRHPTRRRRPSRLWSGTRTHFPGATSGSGRSIWGHSA